MHNYSKNKVKENNKNLIELVKEAKKVWIIGKSTSFLSNALREYRNLVHPKKQVEENIFIDEEVAKIAINAVKISMKEVDKYCSEE